MPSSQRGFWALLLASAVQVSGFAFIDARGRENKNIHVDNGGCAVISFELSDPGTPKTIADVSFSYIDFWIELAAAPSVAAQQTLSYVAVTTPNYKDQRTINSPKVMFEEDGNCWNDYESIRSNHHDEPHGNKERPFVASLEYMTEVGVRWGVRVDTGNQNCTVTSGIYYVIVRAMPNLSADIIYGFNFVRDICPAKLRGLIKPTCAVGEYSLAASCSPCPGVIMHDCSSRITRPVALLMTTHMSPKHLKFIEECWPSMLSRSSLLSKSDIFVYVTGQNISSEWNRALSNIPNRVTVHLRSNPGYHLGAIAAAHDSAFLDKISAERYSWVIRLNPDVLVYNSSRLEALLQEPEVDAILASCTHFDVCAKRSGCTLNHVNTDFGAFRPEILAGISRHRILAGNAELDMKGLMHDVVKHGRERWISAMNPDRNCRLRLPGEIEHEHEFSDDVRQKCLA